LLAVICLQKYCCFTVNKAFITGIIEAEIYRSVMLSWLNTESFLLPIGLPIVFAIVSPMFTVPAVIYIPIKGLAVVVAPLAVCG